MVPLFLQASPPNATAEILKAIISDDSGKALQFTIISSVVICMIIILVLMYLGKLIKNVMMNNEFLKIGPLTIKSKKNQQSQVVNAASNNSRIIDINSFMNILDIIMNVELERVINLAINATNDIHKIELTYDEQSSSIFEKTFMTIQNEYHDQLVLMACEKTHFDIDKIRNTREYFFIIDLLREFKDLWLKQSKEITRRNGFVIFLEDRTKSRTYIDELNDCIFQCIDIRKLESTELRKSDIEKVVIKVIETTQPTLERMFINLAGLKKVMLTKRHDKLEYIDGVIKNSVVNILKDINDKILAPDNAKPHNHRAESNNDSDEEYSD